MKAWKWKYDYTFLDLGSTWKLVVSYTLLPLYPAQKERRVTITYEAGQASYPVWTQWKGEKCCTVGNMTRAIQLIACRYAGSPILTL
jgi:hypothetical protein